LAGHRRGRRGAGDRGAGGADLAALADRFGEHILRPDGSLDRPALARVAFVDDASRADLDRLTHPRITARIAERLAVLGGRIPGPDPLIAVVDHPLLIETGQVGRFDEVVVVIADEAPGSTGWSASAGSTPTTRGHACERRPDDDRRRAAATHLLVNEGSLAELEQRPTRWPSGSTRQPVTAGSQARGDRAAGRGPGGARPRRHDHRPGGVRDLARAARGPAAR
jgi:dephospho-CoA kinase